jgi:hypothetical protein
MAAAGKPARGPEKPVVYEKKPSSTGKSRISREKSILTENNPNETKKNPLTTRKSRNLREKPVFYEKTSTEGTFHRGSSLQAISSRTMPTGAALPRRQAIEPTPDAATGAGQRV